LSSSVTQVLSDSRSPSQPPLAPTCRAQATPQETWSSSTTATRSRCVRRVREESEQRGGQLHCQLPVRWAAPDHRHVRGQHGLHHLHHLGTLDETVNQPSESSPSTSLWHRAPRLCGQTVTYTATVTGPSVARHRPAPSTSRTGRTLSRARGNQTLSGSVNSATATCQVAYSSTSNSPHAITAFYDPGTDPITPPAAARIRSP